MYCQDCRASAPLPGAQREGGAGADRFGALQCQRCGVTLPIHSTARALGEKLSQLARFGLADRGGTTEGTR